MLQASKSEISLQIINENIAIVKAVIFENTKELKDYVRTIAKTEDINKAITLTLSGIKYENVLIKCSFRDSYLKQSLCCRRDVQSP